MNNLDQKVMELEQTINVYYTQLGFLEGKLDRLESKNDELESELNDLKDLVYSPFHKKGKKISLSKRKGLIHFLLGLLAGLTTVLFLLGGGSIIFLLAYIIKVGAIHLFSSLIILVVSVLVLVDVHVMNKLFEKYDFYDDKIRLNIKLFCDTDYSAKRIDNRKEILERKRLGFQKEKKMIEEQISNFSSKIDELESLLEEIIDYKDMFDEKINQMYEKNMPKELREKIGEPFVKVKK